MRSLFLTNHRKYICAPKFVRRTECPHIIGKGFEGDIFPSCRAFIIPSLRLGSDNSTRSNYSLMDQVITGLSSDYE